MVARGDQAPSGAEVRFGAPSGTSDRPQRAYEHGSELSAFDIDVLTQLAEFEIEHQRFRAMQMLYHRRHSA